MSFSQQDLIATQAISNVLHVASLPVSHALIIQCLNCVHDKLRQYCDKIESSRVEGDFAAIAETGKISAELTNQADAIFGGTGVRVDSFESGTFY